MVGARTNRADHAFRFRRGEHELDVLGGLLHQLQQGVEALVRNHVGLVDDEDLVAVPHGRKRRPLAKVTRVVNAAVGGRVDFHDVQGARTAGGELPAGSALPAGLVGGPLRAVEAARQDARRRGLTAPARAREQVGVCHAIGAQRRLQRLRHVFLADHLVEGVGAIPAVQSSGHPSRVVGDVGVCVSPQADADASRHAWLRSAPPTRGGLPPSTGCDPQTCRPRARA